VAARRLTDLTPSEQKRAVALAVLRFLATFALVLAVYYFLPINIDQTGTVFILGFVLGLILLAAIVVWQVRTILRADLPALRAMEALGVVLPFFLCIYAASYLILSASEPTAFNHVLDHSTALYFTIVVFGTVGFGDFIPTINPARMLVSSQVLLDLVFLALVVRVLFGASRLSLRRAGEEAIDEAIDGQN
jgi:voltage-gated potassium channel